MQDRLSVLEDRIARAVAVLQAAPDALIDTKKQIKAVLHCNQVAWAILTEEKYPPSKRHSNMEMSMDAGLGTITATPINTITAPPEVLKYWACALTLTKVEGSVISNDTKLILMTATSIDDIREKLPAIVAERFPGWNFTTALADEFTVQMMLASLQSQGIITVP